MEDVEDIEMPSGERRDESEGEEQAPMEDEEQRDGSVAEHEGQSKQDLERLKKALMKLHTNLGHPGGSPQIVDLIADARCEEAAALSRLVDRALATQHLAVPVVAPRFVLMGVLWVTWQLQSLGTAASSLARVGTVKWLGGRPPVRQTGRDLAELHCVVFDGHVALDDGVPRARTSAVRACRTTLECVAFFRKHKAPVEQFFFNSTGVARCVSFIGEDMWTCMSGYVRVRPTVLGPLTTQSKFDLDQFFRLGWTFFQPTLGCVCVCV